MGLGRARHIQTHIHRGPEGEREGDKNGKRKSEREMGGEIEERYVLTDGAQKHRCGEMEMGERVKGRGRERDQD